MSVSPLAGYEWPDGTVWPPQGDGTPPPVMDSLADFGPAIANVDVDDAVMGILKKWLPTYLRYIAGSRSLGFVLPAPKSWQTTIDNDQFADQSLPGVFVATARVEGTPDISGEGKYETVWLTVVSAVVRGRRPPETRRLASLYELACRLALVHHQDLDGFANKTRWITGGQARPLVDTSGKGRWLGEGTSQYWVFTDAAVQEGKGPLVPDAEPYAPLATVESVDFDPIGGLPIDTTGESV